MAWRTHECFPLLTARFRVPLPSPSLLRPPETVDEYFAGLNNTIQHASVRWGAEIALCVRSVTSHLGRIHTPHQTAPLTPYPRIIVAPQVRHILDSTVASLLANPARKFVYVEQAFFQRWYAEQDAASAAVVAQLVAEGRLSFLNGGWSMHDEATTVYSDMVDNTQVRGG